MSTAQPARSGTLAGISETICARTSSGRDGRGVDAGPEAQPASTTSATVSVEARRAIRIGRG
jgi:hypothetical protein